MIDRADPGDLLTPISPALRIHIFVARVSDELIDRERRCGRLLVSGEIPVVPCNTHEEGAELRLRRIAEIGLVLRDFSPLNRLLERGTAVDFAPPSRPPIARSYARIAGSFCGHIPQPKFFITMPKSTSLQDLLIDELKDLYSAETQLTKALPKMAKAANDEALKAGFEEHLDQTHEHIARLDRVMELLDASPKGKTCKAMKGLVAEGDEKIDEDATPAVKDAALISAAQKVEHYEIAGYGTVRTFAELLGHDEVVSLLQETLDEEAETDRKLTELASTLNLKAETGEESEADEDDEDEEEDEEEDK